MCDCHCCARQRARRNIKWSDQLKELGYSYSWSPTVEFQVKWSWIGNPQLQQRVVKIGICYPSGIPELVYRWRTVAKIPVDLYPIWGDGLI